jgi:Group II intron, maturase-specific domain
MEDERELEGSIVSMKRGNARGERGPCCLQWLEQHDMINPILRGWVNYFAVGHSGRCFTSIKDWVEKTIRRHLMRARKRQGFGWKRWSREWIYNVLGLFNDYRVRRSASLPKVAPAR